MARAFRAAITSPEDGVKRNRRRHLFYYKVASMIIGSLTAWAAITGLAVSVSLLTLGMRPLRDVAATWTAEAPRVNASSPLAHHAGNDTRHLQSDVSMNVFIGIVGFFLSVLGIPDTIHVVVSVELLYGAWHERADMVLQWLKFTQKTTALHAAFAVLVVVALFAVGQNALAVLILGCLLFCFMLMAFLIGIVHRFHLHLICQSSQIVTFQNVTTDNIEE